jgi:hypothetical protein
VHRCPFPAARSLYRGRRGSGAPVRRDHHRHGRRRGALAHRLAPSGRRILLLERGDWLRRERDNWSSQAVFLDARYRAPETWTDGHGRPFKPGIQYYVGGNTKVYGSSG